MSQMRSGSQSGPGENGKSKFIRNLAIMASAGTGKTYQLAMRYILLILRGAAVEDIVAITFTKKAAGEIFEKILSILLELILSDKKLAKAKKSGFLPEETTLDDICTVLRKILTCRKKMHIETNDSFLIQSVQASPAQFGITGNISIQNENDDRTRKEALMTALQDPRFASSSDESKRARQDIYMVLRDSSLGTDLCNLYTEITNLLKEFYPLYLENPDRNNWCVKGSAQWEKNLLDRAGIMDLAARTEALLQNSAYESILCSKGYGKFKLLISCAMQTCRETPCHLVSKDLETIVGFFLCENQNSSPKLNVLKGNAPAVFRVGNSKTDYVVEEDLFSLLQKLVKHIIASEYLLINRKTAAIYDLMNFFDESYALRTRLQGKLTFDDVLYLINNMESKDFGMLQVLRERLALSIDHYLLDEFQDTSDSQWSALRDLVADVIQWNEDGNRFTSFFMVADVKQSLYQWRKGNPEIFHQICKDYAIVPEDQIPALEEKGEICNGILKGLNRSYRSSQNVLQMVNDIFEPAGGDLVFPDRLNDFGNVFNSGRARMGFAAHQSGLSGKEYSAGCSMMLEVTRQDGDSDSSLEEHAVKTICEVIRQIDPFSERRKKKLSVAVLARKNKVLRSFYETAAEYAPELKVSMEGKLFLSDSMGYAFFRQILIYAIHPGNDSACGFFELLRSGEWMGSEESICQRLYPEKNPALLRTLIRAEVDENGFSGFFAHLQSAFPELAREAEYMASLEKALEKAEAEKITSVDMLLQQLDQHCEELRSAGDTVQLMTVHKSKGLGFDVVFYLETKSQERFSDFCKETMDGSLYFAPPSGLMQCSDAVMKNNQYSFERSAYDMCCNIYVALTRAKCAQYFVCSSENENAVSAQGYASDVLRAAFAGKEISMDAGSLPQRFAASLDRSLLEHCVDNDIRHIRASYCAGNPFWFEQNGNDEEKEQENPEEVKSEYSRVCEEAIQTENAFLASLRNQPMQCRVLTGEVLRQSAPSRHKVNPAMRFASMHGAEFGTRIHEICSRIGFFVTEQEALDFIAQYQEDPEVYEILQNAFSNPGFRQVFCPEYPLERCRLLVEQPFLMQNEKGEIIQGIMDRAEIWYDEAGRPLSGVVIDYKTDPLEKEEAFLERYQEQLEVYRQALCRIANLPPEKISCMILAMRKGWVIRF